MKLVVDGADYDITDAVQGASLGDLLALKLQTKTADYLGTTPAAISATFIRVGQLIQAEDSEWSQIELLGDEDFLRSMIGLIWLAKRKQGITLTVAEAGDTGFDKFEVVPDVEEAEAPKESVAAGSEPPPQ